MPGAGRPFPKGNRAAKGKGRPPLPPELKAARKLTRPLLEATLNKYLYFSEAELEAAKVAIETPMLERMIISVMLTAVREGDHASLGFLLDRLVPKQKESTDHNFNFNFSNMPREQVIEAGKEALKLLEQGRKSG